MAIPTPSWWVRGFTGTFTPHEEVKSYADALCAAEKRGENCFILLGHEVVATRTKSGTFEVFRPDLIRLTPDLTR
jgi:hypothetical protein